MPLTVSLHILTDNMIHLETTSQKWAVPLEFLQSFIPIVFLMGYMQFNSPDLHHYPYQLPQHSP